MPIEERISGLLAVRRKGRWHTTNDIANVLGESADEVARVMSALYLRNLVRGEHNKKAGVMLWRSM